ncbi:MAG: T9SS type A sorting domain-containing protein [Paludibacter sp.]
MKSATGAFSIAGSATISSNFSAGSFTHTLQGNWTNNGTFTAGTSTISLTGGSGQTIGGSASTSFYNLTKNSAGLATLGVATTATNTLTLTSGNIDIAAYNLTAGAISGGSATSYVKTTGVGRLVQSVDYNVTKIFPVGRSAYNPGSITNNSVGGIDNFYMGVTDDAITNANDNTRTVNRRWYLYKNNAGTVNVTLAFTYNSGEGATNFNAASNPKFGLYNGSFWAYTNASVAGTTLTATGDIVNLNTSNQFISMGSDAAFSASKLAVISMSPSNPTLGVANVNTTIQSQNSQSVPTIVLSSTAFNLTATNTTLSSTFSGTIGANAYQTSVSSIGFTTSTYVDPSYRTNATITATRTSGETLAAGTSAAFDVYNGTIYEPIATENWNASNGWRKSTDGGNNWTNPATLPASNIFGTTDIIRIPLGITLTTNVTASAYSVLVFGTLDIPSGGSLTINHNVVSTLDADYNLHVHGTVKNSGGTLTNSNTAYPFEIHGGTFWHAVAGGSIPTCNFTTFSGTTSTCKVQGAGVGGLNQTFENFTLTSGNQTLTGNMTLSGVLTLTSGVISTGVNSVIQTITGSSTSASSTAYINGNYRLYAPNGSNQTITFPVGDTNYYSPISFTFEGTSAGSGYIDAFTTAVAPPLASGLSQSKYINRKWKLTNNGVSFTSYSTSLTYNVGDKIGSPVTGNLALRRYRGASWIITNGAATGNTITASSLAETGASNYSEFYVGENDCLSTNYVWLGGTDTDWNTASNWCSNAVPTSTTDVTIPTGITNYPVISGTSSCKALNIVSGASLTISGANTLNVYGALTNTGTFTTGTSTVVFAGSSAQTITGTTVFNNVTVSNAAGVTSASNQTVNGTLNLTTNASSTKGSLDMGSYTLTMGESATNTGVGDVTGIIRREHTFTGNTTYTFGHPYTSIKFVNVSGGVKPQWISCKVAIGTAPTWRSLAVNRTYSFTEDGTGTDRTVTNLHYLDSELHGIETDESKLVFWDAYAGPTYSSVFPRGKTTNDASNNYVSLTGMAINFIAPYATADTKQWGLGYTNVTKITWTGNGSPTFYSDWSLPGNWNGGVPTANDDVVIPLSLPVDTHGYPTRNLNASTVPSVCKSLEIEAGASLTVDNFDITINGSTGAWKNNGSFTPGTGTIYLTHGNTSEITTITGTTSFNNLSVAANTKIQAAVGSVMKIGGTFSTGSGVVLDFNTYSNTLEYNGTVAQTLPPTTTFNNLTVSNPAGVSSSSDQTVTGVLSLTTNPDATHGSLDMGSNTLNLGGSATNSGLGDVSGIVKREHTFVGNNAYTFGNQYTTITFVNVTGSSKPTWVSCKIAIGAAPSWRTGALKRSYSFAQSGGTDRTITNLHYLDSELNGSETDETKLVFWDAYTGPDYTNNRPRGMSNYSATNNWIGLTGMAINFIATSTSLDVKQWGLSYTNVTKNTWTGNGSASYPGDWSLPGNWNGGVPTATSVVVIPTTLPSDTHGYPSNKQLSSPAICKSIEIEPGAILAVDTFKITVKGAAGAWINNGTFTAGTGTVTFANDTITNTVSLTGTTNFNHLTVDANTYIEPSTGSITRIAGTLTAGAGSILDFTATHNTIEYNGTGGQTVLNAVGPSSDRGYYSLILSGSSTKTMPSSALSVAGNFSMSGTASATLLEALTTGGNVTLGAGTALTTGAYTHLVGGNWTNNGATFTNTGSTINFNGTTAQAIGGTSSNSFDNLNVSNSTANVSATNDISVASALTVGASATLDMGTNLLTSMSSNSGSGTLKTQNTSSTPIPTGKTWSSTVVYNNATTSQTVMPATYTGLQISNPISANASGTLNTTTLTIDYGAVLDMGTNVLNTMTTNGGTGELKTQNTSSLPIPSGKTWPGIMEFNGSAAQTAVAGTFGNLEIDNAAGVTLATDAVVNVSNSLLIYEGKKLQIGTETELIANSISNNAGTSGLVIKSSSTAPNGSLIFHNDYNAPVAATVEMYSKAFYSGAYKWQFFGIPIRTMTAFPTFNGGYVRQYNEAGTGAGLTSDKHWIQLANASTLLPFKGYEAGQAAAKTFYFTGDLVNSDYASGQLPITVSAQYPGQHLIGNPYTAAIDISKIEFGTIDTLIIENTIYLYNTGSYADWTTAGSGTISANAFTPGQYVSIPKSVAGTNGLPSQIPSMQAFLVMATANNSLATVSIPYSAVGTVVKNTAMQRARTSLNVSTRIDVKGTGYGDRMWLISEPTCTRGFDNGWDGYKSLYNSVTQIFAIETSGDYQVNSVANINNTYLGFQAGASETYTMTFTHENMESQYPALYLIDLMNNNQVTDITLSGSTYSFSANATGTPDKRFKIVTSLGTVTANKTVADAKLNVYCSQKTIFIDNKLGDAGSLMIYDITGRFVKKFKFSANNISSLPMNIPTGSYILKAKVNNEEVVQSIVVQ